MLTVSERWLSGLVLSFRDDQNPKFGWIFSGLFPTTLNSLAVDMEWQLPWGKTLFSAPFSYWFVIHICIPFSHHYFHPHFYPKLYPHFHPHFHSLFSSWFFICHPDLSSWFAAGMAMTVSCPRFPICQSHVFLPLSSQVDFVFVFIANLYLFWFIDLYLFWFIDLYLFWL